jgi:type I restriction enzyme S subunit
MFGKLRPYLAKSFVAEASANCSSELLVLRPNGSASARFLKFSFLNPEFIDLVNSSTFGAKMPRANWDFIGNIPISLPPLSTQKAIANYLDEKTAAIDALIEKKRKLLDLLAEERAALINQAVTKGLDPGVPMKGSGIPWIGQIPAHWAMTAVKRACLSVRDGTHAPPPRVSNGECRLLSVRNIQGGEFILRDDDRLMAAESFAELERSYTVRQGDVVLASVGATTGKSAVVGAVEKISVQRSLAILRPDLGKISAGYLHHWLDATVTQHSIQLKASQYAAQGGIYLEDVANLPLALPPKAEQARNLNAISPAIGRLRRMEANLQDSCARLQEYRQALITAAVTGQLDIEAVA